MNNHLWSMLLLPVLLTIITACVASDEKIPPTESAIGDCLSQDCPTRQICRRGECVFPEDEPDTGHIPQDENEAPNETEEEVPETPGVGDPCTTPTDCPSGFCIEAAGDGRRVCTDFCDPENSMCPRGFVCAAVTNSGADRTFLCFPQTDSLCTQCELDSECGGLSDRCLTYPDGRFCGRDCRLQACPDGYNCVELEGPNGSTMQCRPQTATCSGCLDHDGDGRGTGPSCLGRDCQEDNPAIHEGAEEICDGQDNNCDGNIDEGFDLSNNPMRCGTCDRVCSFDGAEALCVEGECVRGPCLENRYDIDQLEANGCEHTCEPTESGIEICNGRDEDCDAVDDEGCPEALTTGRDRDLNAFGGPGGGPFRLICEPGQAAVGVDLRIGSEIDRVQVICQRITLGQNRGTEPYSYQSTATGNQSRTRTAGGGGGGQRTMTCPPGSFLHRTRVRSGLRVDQLSLTCARVDYVGYPEAGRAQLTDTLSNTYGGNGGGLRDETRCRPDEFIAGFYGRSGSRVDRLGVVCRKINISVR